VKRAGVDIPTRTDVLDERRRENCPRSMPTSPASDSRSASSCGTTTIARLNTPQIVFTHRGPRDWPLCSAARAQGHRDRGRCFSSAVLCGLSFGRVGPGALGWELGNPELGRLGFAAGSGIAALHTSVREQPNPEWLQPLRRTIRPTSMDSKLRMVFTPDSGQVAAQTFQAMGEVNLARS